MKPTCECAAKGFCTRRDAYVPNPQWKQCQAGQVEHVDAVIESLATNVQYKSKDAVAYRVQYNHWIPLHNYAVKHRDNWDAFAAELWYWGKWVVKIPKGCNCKDKWMQLDLKPDFSSPKAFFEWAWKAHDLVNEQLGKSYRPTLPECYRIWNW